MIAVDAAGRAYTAQAEPIACAGCLAHVAELTVRGRALVRSSMERDRVAIAPYSVRLARALRAVGGDDERVTDGPGYRRALEVWTNGLASHRWTVRLVIEAAS